jgi:hypothetical protein
VGSNPTLSAYLAVFIMTSRADKMRLFVAAFVGRPRLEGLGSSRPARLEPRQERFFDRPFMYLVENAGVLVPVTVGLCGDWDGAAARGERAGVEADALGFKN